MKEWRICRKTRPTRLSYPSKENRGALLQANGRWSNFLESGLNIPRMIGRLLARGDWTISRAVIGHHVQKR